MNSKNIKNFKDSLLTWYQKNKRDLPWRRTKDPYAIWLSEIMLQQTTVDVVIPYYEQFLKNFPHLRDVAQTQESELLKMWAGLGYYNRIRNFQKAVQKVETELDGVIPSTKEDLITLPGLGDYTAAAVASIAFNEPVAVVDGNVMRVLARLFAFEKDIASSEAKQFFRSKANELLERNNPGDFNQAMMELGATVCTKQKTACPQCPIQSHCEAYKEGLVDQLPFKKNKVKLQEQEWFALIFKKESSIVLRQRKKPEIMAGLWEIPLVENMDNRDLKTLTQIQHTIMNKKMKISPVIGCKKPPPDSKWIALEKMADLPLTTITRKIISAHKAYFETSSL